MDEIKPDDFYDRLNKSPTTDPNLNCDTIHEEITRAKKTHAKQISKFYKFKHKKSTWIIQGLLISIRY